MNLFLQSTDKCAFSDQRGFSLIELCIVGTILGIVTILISQTISEAYQNHLVNILEANLNNYRSQIISAIQNNTAWNQTVADPNNNSPLNTGINLNCLNNGNCIATPPTPIELLDSQGNVLVAKSPSTLGINSSGAVCNSFTLLGDLSCPAQYVLRASISCLAICTSPVVTITGTVSIGKTKMHIAINPVVFAFTQVRTLPKRYTLVCATANYSQAGGIVIDPASNSLTSSQILGPIIKLAPWNGTDWGLVCVSGFNLMGCSATMGPSGDPSSIIKYRGVGPNGAPGCFGSPTNWADATISLTCCGAA